MHSASCPFKVNLSLWPSISSSICLSSKNTCDTAVLESFEGTQNCHETKYVHKCFGQGRGTRGGLGGRAPPRIKDL